MCARMRLTPLDEESMAKANDPDRAGQHDGTLRGAVALPGQVLGDLLDPSSLCRAKLKIVSSISWADDRRAREFTVTGDRRGGRFAAPSRRSAPRPSRGPYVG